VKYSFYYILCIVIQVIITSSFVRSLNFTLLLLLTWTPLSLLYIMQLYIPSLAGCVIIHHYYHISQITCHIIISGSSSRLIKNKSWTADTTDGGKTRMTQKGPKEENVCVCVCVCNRLVDMNDMVVTHSPNSQLPHLIRSVVVVVSHHPLIHSAQIRRTPVFLRGFENDARASNLYIGGAGVMHMH
jgi:hypothetical protein